MRPITSFITASVIALTSAAAFGQAISPIGPRAAALGGAWVALADDPTAIETNPAGVSLNTAGGAFLYSDQGRVRDDLTAQLESLQGLLGSLDDIDRRAGDALRAREILETMAAENPSLSGVEATGFFAGARTYGIGVYRTRVSAAVPAVDLTHVEASLDPETSFISNDSRLLLRGLDIQNYELAISGALSGESMVFGLTARYMKATVSEDSINLFDVGALDARDAYGELSGSNEISDNAFSFDAGAIILAHPKLRLGVVGKHLNSPTFELPGGGEFELQQRWRAGLAIVPHEKFQLSADIDLSNPNGLDGLPEGRELAAGAELRLADSQFMLRGGVGFDLDRDFERGVRLAAGAGVHTSSLIADAAVIRSNVDGSLGFALQIGYEKSPK